MCSSDLGVEAFIGCETLFHSTSLFQMSKQISDAMYHEMYDRARMKCPSIFRILFFIFFFPYFNECEMQMSYADAKYLYDAHVSFQRCNFHDADVPCDGANATFIYDGASTRIYP